MQKALYSAVNFRYCMFNPLHEIHSVDIREWCLDCQVVLTLDYEHQPCYGLGTNLGGVNFYSRHNERSKHTVYSFSTIYSAYLIAFRTICPSIDHRIVKMNRKLIINRLAEFLKSVHIIKYF